MCLAEGRYREEIDSLGAWFGLRLSASVFREIIDDQLFGGYIKVVNTDPRRDYRRCYLWALDAWLASDVEVDVQLRHHH